MSWGQTQASGVAAWADSHLGCQGEEAGGSVLGGLPGLSVAQGTLL